MNLRKLSLILITVGLVVIFIYGTGAFDSAFTSRTADVSVVGDREGYLGLQPSEGPNGQYAVYEDGKLQIRLDGTLTNSKGINPDSVTTVASIFVLRNQGPSEIGVWLSNTNDAITFIRSNTAFESRSNMVALAPGEQISVGVRIDTRHTDSDSLRPTFSIHTTSEVKTAVDRGQGSDEQSSNGQSNENTQKTGGQDNNQGKGIAEQINDGVNKGWKWAKNGAEGVWNWGKEKVDYIRNDRFETEGGEFDLTGDGESFKEEINTRIESIQYGDLDADGHSLLDDPVHEIMSFNHEEFPHARNTLKGLAYGIAGRPDGQVYAEDCDHWLCVSTETANSEGYAAGWMLSGLSIYGDVRDGGQNFINGKFQAAFVDGVGVAPIAGDYIKIKKILELKNIRHFDNAKVYLKSDAVSDYSDMKKVRRIDEMFGEPAMALTRKEIPAGTVVKAKEKGYNLNRMERMVDDGVSSNHIEYFVEKNVPLPVVDKYISARTISSKKIVELHKKYKDKFKSNWPEALKIRSKFDSAENFAKSKKATDMSDTEKVKILDTYTDGNAGRLTEQGVPSETVLTAIKRNRDLDGLLKMTKDGVSAKNIKYFVDNDIPASAIKKLRDKNVASGRVVTLDKAMRELGTPLTSYKSALIYCSWQEDNKDIGQNIKTTCSKIPSPPIIGDKSELYSNHWYKSRVK